MQVETQVVHAVVAVGEAEVDAASTELHLLLVVLIMVVFLVVFSHDGGVIEGLAFLALQYAALQPYLISTGKYWHVVEQNVVFAVIGENQCPCGRDGEGLETSLESLGLVKHHMR